MNTSAGSPTPTKVHPSGQDVANAPTSKVSAPTHKTKKALLNSTAGPPPAVARPSTSQPTPSAIAGPIASGSKTARAAQHRPDTAPRAAALRGREPPDDDDASGLHLPLLLRVEDAMHELSVSRRTIYALISAGQLELVRIGLRCTRLKTEDVLRLAGTRSKPLRVAALRNQRYEDRAAAVSTPE